jgi:Rieske Fe-S protein
VVTCGFEKVAVYRDGGGHLHEVSAVCTHMQCVVRWNAAERTWDCPCHGSRFGLDGKVLHGPAVDDLTVIEVRRSETPRPIG